MIIVRVGVIRASIEVALVIVEAISEVALIIVQIVNEVILVITIVTAMIGSCFSLGFCLKQTLGTQSPSFES